MTNRKQIIEPADMARVIQGGKAIFTLVSARSGTRFTYKAMAPKDCLKDGNTDFPVIFLSVLSDSDNEGRYSYLGQVFPLRSGLRYFHGKKARAGADAPSAQLIAWLLGQIQGNGTKLDQVEFWHEGKCARCGRKLTVPESIDTGFGPDCAAMMGITYTKRSAIRAKAPEPVEDAASAEAEMQRMEAEGDRAQTARDERAKQEARAEMEGKAPGQMDLDAMRDRFRG